MNAYQYAMRMENEAEKFYRDLANKCSDTSIKGVFEMLADEELKHFKVFEKMAQNEELPSIENIDIKARAKDIFSKIKSCNRRYSFTNDQVLYYEKAAQVEEDAYQFYLKKAEEMEDSKQKEAFILIAKEEQKHQILMENIASFVASPDTWLESAEFYNIIKD
ncbi:ferritin-like domain-containing protein [Sulfurospirillum arcachonense]|uniref:ferritin-like domain-containing protein n=1 Tax=Sulfurospirillum arcachonense TaxID=57666 RepID=UPI00046AF221|nr:ferritin family protein [Sulfurospirillum arcachonense]